MGLRTSLVHHNRGIEKVRVFFEYILLLFIPKLPSNFIFHFLQLQYLLDSEKLSIFCLSCVSVYILGGKRTMRD